MDCFIDQSSLFSEGRPDVVFICSPPDQHLQQLEQAIEGNCHVFLEKPFSAGDLSADHLLVNADAKQLKVMSGFNMRFVDPIRRLKMWLDEGKIGKLLSCRISVCSYMPNWHPWEDYRDGFMAFHSSGGGALFDCVHGIDMAQWFAGPISSLTAFQRTLSLEMETDDITCLIAETEDKVVVDLHFDFLDRSNRRRIELIGTDGTAIWTLEHEHRLVLHPGDSGNGLHFTSRFDWDSCYIAEIKHFFDCIESDLPVSTDGWNGLDTQKLLAMAKESNSRSATVRR